jgi:F0F1-type ATP synthase assembly protein I
MPEQEFDARAERERLIFRRIVAIMALIAATFVGGVFVFFLVRDMANAEPWMMEVFRAHPGALLGLPLAALAALCVVSFSKPSRVPLNLRGSVSSFAEHRAR